MADPDEVEMEELVSSRAAARSSASRASRPARAPLRPPPLLYFASHAAREMNKRRFNYCLGVSTCFLVVVVAAACVSLLAKAPVVFLQQGEAESGQIDVLLEASDASRAPFLNYSAVAANAGGGDLSYHSPRLVLDALSFSAACSEAVEGVVEDPLGADVAWRYDGNGEAEYEVCEELPSCMPLYCPDTYDFKPVQVFFVDSLRERRMELGRRWPYPEPLPPGQALVSSKTARKRGLAEGDTAWLEVKDNLYWKPLRTWLLADGMERLGVPAGTNRSHAAFDAIDARPLFVAPVTVAGVVSDFKGKVGSSDDEIWLMEYSSYHAWMLDALDPGVAGMTLDEAGAVTVRDALAAAGPAVTDYASRVAVNMPPSRVDPYVSTDYDTVQRRVVRFASRALYAIGFPDVDAALDILASMYQIRFFTLYLGLILSVILTILFVLSTMLIYSLLTISIETRTFELGVHRMVGMSRCGLVGMLLTQAASYALPAWALGLVVAQGMAAYAIGRLEDAVEVPVDAGLTSSAVWLATGLGLGIPAVASVVPIRNALGRNLHDSLDTRHSKTVAVKVTVERSEDGAVSPAWLVLGLGLAVFGFLIYYLLPLSLLTFNLALFFNIFFALLLGMLFGLILLSLNAEHAVERLVVAVFLFWERRPVRAIVLKNLVAHRVRNRKTTMMFALALGFVIFITVAYRLELKTAEHRILKSQGARLRVTGDDPIPPASAQRMDALVRDHPAAHSHAWISQRLGEALADDISGQHVTNLGHIAEAQAHFWGVSPNFYDVALGDFLISSDEDTSTGLSFSEQLCTARGSQMALLPSSLVKSHDLSLGGSWLAALEAEPSEEWPNTRHELRLRRMRAAAFLDSSPVFEMTRFPTLRRQDVAVSFDTLLRLANGTVQSVEDLYMKVLLVRPDPSASEAEMDDLVLQLGALADRESDAEVWDFRDTRSSLDKTNAVMDLVFSVATYIAMGLCLFSLMASMYTNIFEQSKEIAVLRALGLRQGQVVRMYVYEAFVLVTSASVLGFVIGCIMAWTMVLQRVLFTQLPVTVEFPWLLFLLVVAGAVACALLASCGPARALVRRTVAQVMRTVV